VTRITELPQEHIISMLKGTIDYYVWCGIPCARRWPRKPKLPRAESTQPAINRFAYAHAIYPFVQPSVIKSYDFISSDTDLTRRDYFIRAFCSGIKY